jgi:hypothetical protein
MNEQALGLGIGLTELLYGAIVCALFYRRRNLFPIKGTSTTYQLAFIGNMIFINFIMWITAYAVDANSTSYGFNLFLQMLFVMTASLCAVFVWKVYFSFRISEDKNIGRDHSWFVRHARYGSNKFLHKVQIGIVLVHVLISLIYSGATGAFQITLEESMQSVLDADWAVFIMLFVAVPGILVLILAWKMRFMKDGYFFVRSMFCTAISVIITVLVYIVVSAATTAPAYVSSVIASIVVFEGITGIITFPLLLSIKFERLKLLEEADEVETQVLQQPNSPEQHKQKVEFSEVLNNPQLLEKFRRFLVSEFSVEYIMFYLDVNEFRKQCLVDQLFDKEAVAMKIYESYFADSVENQVALSFPALQEVKQTILSIRNGSQQPSANMFDRAQKEVYYAMESDAFRRFKRTMTPEELQKASLPSEIPRPSLDI